MALQVWLPLNGDLHNQGLDQIVKNTSNSGAVINNNGKIGKCYSFDGTDDWIQWSINKENYGNKPLSFCCWFKSDKSKSTGCIMDIAADLCLGYNYNSNNVTFYYWRVYGTSSSRSGDSNTTTNSFDANLWHHIAVVYDNTTNKIYVDGILQNTWQSKSQAYWVPLLGASYNKLSIGKSAGSTTWIGGLVNDARIYDHALSEKEVEEISKGLVLHYQLNQPNQNLITEETYSITPWSDAIQAHEIYQGKFAYRVTNNILYSKTGNGANNIFPNITYSENTQYIMSVDWRDDYRTDNKSSSLYLRFHYTDGTYTQIISPANSKKEWTHAVLVSTAGKTVDKCTTTYGNGGQLYLTNLKLEKGIIETFFNHDSSNIVYDSSGYDNNGQLHEISVNNNCSKFDISSKFNGSNSYIKVIDNKWMPQHTRELTINLWAKAASWPTSGRIFSCTETGGFNTEAGSSGYWRFPIYVCTNEAQTSYAYKYDSKEVQISALPINQWTMLTFVYNSTGTKTYINGELHHTYTNTSYGIHFNMNARLFLGCEANTASPSSPYFNGEESDFRIYTTALMPAQIKELYETSKIVDGTTLKARDLEVSA